MRIRWPVIAAVIGLALTAGAAGVLVTSRADSSESDASKPSGHPTGSATATASATSQPPVSDVRPVPAAPVVVKPGHGELDRSFGQRGVLSVPAAEDLGVDQSGRIWVIGAWSRPGGSAVKYNRRFTAEGRRDPAFIADPNNPGWEGLAAGEVTPMPSGASVASWDTCCGGADPLGTANLEGVSVADEPAPFAGSVPGGDTSVFPPDQNPVGTTPGTIKFGGSMRLPDGRWRVCLSEAAPSGNESPSMAVLWGLLPDGHPDLAVGPNGLRILAGLESCGAGPEDGVHRGLFTDGADRLYAIGTASKPDSSTHDDDVPAAVARIDVNGVPDASYGDGGLVQLTAGQPPGQLVDAEVTRLGTVFLGVSSKRDFGARGRAAVVKLTDGGALDTSFGTDGVLRLTSSGRSVRLDSVGLLQGDRLILGLTDQTAFHQSGRLMAVSRTSGQPDARFGTGGVLASDLLVQDTAQQGSHGLLLAGPKLPGDPEAFMQRVKGLIERRRI